MRANLRDHVYAPLLDCAGKVRVYDLQRFITIYRQFWLGTCLIGVFQNMRLLLLE